MAYPNQLVNQAVQGGGNLLQLPKYGQGQQGGVENILQQLLSQGSQGLKNPQQGFQPIEEASRRGFENRTIPLLAERFGGLNATGSSGYQNALTGAGTDFELGLNAQRQQFGQQNIGQLLQMLQLGMQPTSENVFTPPSSGGFGSAVAGGLGAGAGLLGTTGLSSALGAGGSLAPWLASLGLGATATAAAPIAIPLLLAALLGGGAYGLSQLGGD